MKKTLANIILSLTAIMPQNTAMALEIWDDKILTRRYLNPEYYESERERVIEINRQIALERNGNEIYQDRRELGVEGIANLLGLSIGVGATGNQINQYQRELTPIYQEMGQRYNISPEILSAICETESGGESWSISRTGAIGACGLTRFVYTQFEENNNPFNPEHNIEMSARYLAQMIRQFGGDQDLAILAYNAGPGTIRSELSNMGTPAIEKFLNYEYLTHVNNRKARLNPNT